MGLPGLTKWEIPDQLVENTAPACTMHCTSILDNLNQRFATGFHDPRFTLTPQEAERITREAFAYGRVGYKRVEDSRGNGRVQPDELPQFARDLSLIRNNRYNGAVIEAPGTFSAQAGRHSGFYVSGALTVRQAIIRALSTYPVVIIVSPNSATSGFIRQGTSTNGFYVDTHTQENIFGSSTDKVAGEIVYGSIESLQNYLFQRFENAQGEMLQLYGFGRL